MQLFLRTKEVCAALGVDRKTLDRLRADTPAGAPRPWVNVSTRPGRSSNYRWTTDRGLLLQWMQAVEAKRAGQWHQSTDEAESTASAGVTRTARSDSTPFPVADPPIDFSWLLRMQRTRAADGPRSSGSRGSDR